MRGHDGESVVVDHDGLTVVLRAGADGLHVQVRAHGSCAHRLAVEAMAVGVKETVLVVLRDVLSFEMDWYGLVRAGEARR